MKYCFLSFLMFGMVWCSYGQYTLIFCEDIDAEGNPKMAATAFMVSDRGGMLRFLVRSDQVIEPGNLKYQLFYINETGNEEAVAEFQQIVETDWNYVWKDVVFFESGTYRVKVYNSKEDYLTSANLNIKRRQN